MGLSVSFLPWTENMFKSIYKNLKISWAQWHTPVFPATQEAEAGGPREVWFVVRNFRGVDICTRCGISTIALPGAGAHQIAKGGVSKPSLEMWQVRTPVLITSGITSGWATRRHPISFVSNSLV